MLPADEIAPLAPELLHAWLARIGIDTPPAPTLPSLDALIAAQLVHLPFENLNSLLGRPVAIDLPSIFDKLVRQGRGGYCFELNTLFCAGLKALGFTVIPLAARVRWDVPEATPTGLSHMLLRVEVEHESYIADVGFGGPTPDRALPLSLPIDDAVPYRLLPSPASATSTAFHAYDLAVRNPADGEDGWRAIYRFDLTPQPRIDFVARNWYVSTHPDSPFTHTLMVARSDGDARLALGNGDFSERAPDGSVRKQVLRTADAVIDTLAERFHIRLDEDLRGALASTLPALLAREKPL
ncbi:arylamine N-acetyltransferase family protein [Cupriavidus sp. RAF12]|uniref:arylamine N-acetyltransferase family protein n=1 Tax=Cupriavidus sp. RAF12 TaxID=3233050 RepID=UPI003F92D574